MTAVESGERSSVGIVRARWQEIRALWPRFGFLPILLFVGWPLSRLLAGERRWELLPVALIGCVLPYVGPRSKRLFLGILPLGLVAIFYDSMRFVKNLGLSPERIHVCDLRQVELDWFGIETASGPATVHDVLQARATLPLDVLCAIPYGTFLLAVTAFAVFLYFRDAAAMRRFTWAFLALNVAGFVTHHAFPAAPPWYFHAHGCVADLSVHGNEGPNLARVDAWMGVPYFHGLYSRSTDVFGALPSLHVAYPLLIALEGWDVFGKLRGVRWLPPLLRATSIVFVVWMAVSAVYLDHHWIIDVIAGTGFATLTFAVFRWPGRRRAVSESPVTSGVTVT